MVGTDICSRDDTGGFNIDLVPGLWGRSSASLLWAYQLPMSKVAKLPASSFSVDSISLAKVVTSRLVRECVIRKLSSIHGSAFSEASRSHG